MSSPRGVKNEEGMELKRRFRLAAGWAAGFFLLLLAFVSLLHARVAAIIFLVLAARVFPPAREWLDGLGRLGKIVLSIVGAGFILWLLLLGT